MERIISTIDFAKVPTAERIAEMLDRANVRYSVKKLPSGSLIGWDDEPQLYACFLAEGHIEIFVISKDGRKKVVDELVDRGFFGFQVIREGCHPHATAQAISDSTIITIPKDSFYQALHRCDDFADLVVWYLYELLHAKTQEVAAQAFYSVHQRVALFLLEMMGNGPCTEEGREVNAPVKEIHLGNSRIADILGASRNSVTSSLSLLQKQGAIAKGRNSIVILRADILRSIVGTS